MKALVLVEYNRFVVADVPEPTIGPQDVLVQVGACGICGSDVHGMDGSTGRRKPPIIMGHEAAGTIVRAGAEVRGWDCGDRVTFDSTISCGRCAFCTAGRVNLCNHRRVLGVSCDEFKQDGAFADYVAVPQNILYRMPESLSFERAAMVEPVSIAVHAVGRVAPRLNESAVVVGVGMIGLFVVQALRAAGCGRIFAVDLEPKKLALACRLGADEGFSPKQTDVVAEVARRTGGLGADIAVEAVGLPAPVATATWRCRPW
jgi:L-iditol 2-dehydrogenase